MKLKKYYTWKILDEENNLKDIPVAGPYYDEIMLDGYYDSIPAAEQGFHQFFEECKVKDYLCFIDKRENYILIEVYMVTDK